MMATFPAWEVPTHPTYAGRPCIGTRCRDHSGIHRAPYSEDAEIAAGWRSAMWPARTIRRAAAA